MVTLDREVRDVILMLHEEVKVDRRGMENKQDEEVNPQNDKLQDNYYIT